MAEGVAFDIERYRVPAGGQITGSAPDHVRSRGVLRDIYARHGISGSTPVEDALLIVSERAKEAGVGDEYGQPTTAWANPDEQANARLKYAMSGGDAADKRSRWNQSAYLMDPGRQKFWDEYGRDMDFLSGVMGATTPTGPVTDARGREVTAGVRETASHLPNLLRLRLDEWDRSGRSPLHRDGLFGETYAGTGGIGFAVSNALDNTPFNALEFFPDTIRYATTSGVSAAEAPGGAANTFHSRQNHRLSTPAPILPDLADGATMRQRADRLRDLRDLVAKGQADSPAQRIKDATGITPSAFFADALAAAESIADGTQAIPLLFGARAAAKGAKTAGKIGAELAKDSARDVAFSGAVMGATGGTEPDQKRTWPEYFTKPVELPERVPPEDRREAMAQLSRMRREEGSVSAANARALQKLNAHMKPWAPLR